MVVQNNKSKDIEVSAGGGGGGKSTYLYYMMPSSAISGQCSPSSNSSSDTIDSGTGSDLENTPPPLPKKMSSKSAKSTSVKISQQLEISSHQQRRSIFTDSEESESSLSCDSLNSADLNIAVVGGGGSGGLVVAASKIPVPPPMMPTLFTSPPPPIKQTEFDKDDSSSSLPKSTNNVISKMLLPDSLLRDIRAGGGSIKLLCSRGVDDDDSFGDEPSVCDDDEDEDDDSEVSSAAMLNRNMKNNKNNTVFNSNYNNKMASSSNGFNDAKVLTPSIGLNKTARSIDIYAAHNKDYDGQNNYENDKFYKFHINERDVNDDGVADEDGGGKTIAEAISNGRDDESFAGYRELNGGMSTIRSSKGTVRGVKNRVRNGIVTFLQMQQSNVKVSSKYIVKFNEKDNFLNNVLYSILINTKNNDLYNTFNYY